MRTMCDRICVPLLAGLALVCLSMQAQAAVSVTVIGSSRANECYQAALLGGGPSDEDVCTRAIQDDGLLGRDLVATYVNRGIIRNQLRRLDAALEDFNAALKIAPDLGEAYVNRGNTMFFMRRYEAAVADYTTGIEKKTSDPQAAYYNRGLAYEALKKPDLAEADYRQALTIKPDFELAKIKLELIEEERTRRAREQTVTKTPPEG